MKVYTDTEQNKKLARFLPIESSDMYYPYVLPKSDRIKHNPEIGNPVNALKWYNKGYTTSGKEPVTLDEYCVPCWSLGALLNILPHCIDVRYDLVLGKLPDNESWYVMYDDVDHFTKFYVTHSNLIDACVEMILKLHEQKQL